MTLSTCDWAYQAMAAGSLGNKSMPNKALQQNRDDVLRY
jgi:hypothetical protein